jgi:hypothetical protein
LTDSNTKFNKAPRHDDNNNPSNTTSSQAYLRIIGRPLSAHAATPLDLKSWTQAHRCVLVSYPGIDEFTSKHKKILSEGRRKSKREIESDHHRKFHTWFSDHVRTNLSCYIQISIPILIKSSRLTISF